MVKVSIKYENWKGTRYAVARIDGRIDQRRKVKGTGLKKQDFVDLYKKQNSFYKNRIRDRRRHVTENTWLKDVKLETGENPSWNRKPIRKPDEPKAQYMVQGLVNGRMYYGRSPKVGTYPWIQTSQEAKKEAWDNFLKRIGKEQGLAYQVDEGISIIEDGRVRNIKEGWVYYT